MVNILYFSYLLIPIALITGPFLTNLVSILGIIIFIYLTLKQQLYNYWIQKIFLYFLLFSLFLITISLFSSEPLFSLKSSISFLRYSIFFISIQYIINIKPRFILNFTYILLIAILIVSISVVIEYLIYVFNTSDLSEKYRFSGIFFEERIAGYFIIHVLPLFIGIAFLKKGLVDYQHSKKLLFFVILLSSVAIILSGERTALFYLVLLIFLYSIFYLKATFKSLISILLILSGIFIFIINTDNLKQRYFNQTFIEMHLFSENPKILSTKHQAFFSTSLRMFFHNPLSGIGPNMYRIHSQKPEYIDKENENPSTHPHNLYLQLLAETGLIGGAFLFSLFFILSFKLFKRFYFNRFMRTEYKDIATNFILFSLFIAIWPFAPSMNVFGSYNLFYLILPLGFLISRSN